jgi:hypothetical protein
VAYLIGSLVDSHLVKLIQNPFGVTSLKSYGEFLALPTDLSTLEERHRDLTRAVEFIRGPKESASDATGDYELAQRLRTRRTRPPSAASFVATAPPACG